MIRSTKLLREMEDMLIAEVEGAPVIGRPLDGSFFLVYEYNGRIRGYAEFTHPVEHYIFLKALIVMRGPWRPFVGYKLCEAVKDIAKKNGCKYIRVGIRNNDEKMNKILSKYPNTELYGKDETHTYYRIFIGDGNVHSNN